ncbi:hypothetical protein niasHT_035873 [Heterodera trifolii]|uniref:Uncharacterized protein n=1 Tax=Heterodera trifolii TaxID=157864 RepID=A0ABD2I9J1_9BILA
MSDRRKEAEEKMAKAIFISADCWLCVFELLTPSQLGQGIAIISHRFDYYVDEHFKTRKWTLAFIQIRRKIGENGTDEMEIVNFRGKAVPIPQIQMPSKVNGFESIKISFIDQNTIAFLHRFRPIFAACPINLSIHMNNDSILDMIVRNIWPMLEKNIYVIELTVPRHPMDKRWPNGFSLRFKTMCQSCSNARCMAFTNASSPANFIVVISFRSSLFVDSVVPFVLTNGCTHEQLVLKRINDIRRFLLIRCPIARDENKWTKWEEEAIDWKFYDQWNQISILTFRETRGCPSRRKFSPK